MDENRKIMLLSVLVVVMFGAMLLPKVSPRQWRTAMPYLRWAVVGVGALGVGAVGVVVARKVVGDLKQSATNKAVADGPTVFLRRPKEAPPVNLEKTTIWKRLAYAQPTTEHVSFEVGGNADRQFIAVHASETKLRAVSRELLQEWSDIQRRPAEPKDEPTLVPPGWWVYWVEVGPSSADRPIVCSSRDPLMAVLSEVADTASPTRGLLQVITHSDFSTRRRLGQKSAELRGGPTQNAGARYQITKEAKELEARGAELFLETVVRVSAISPDPERAKGTAVALGNTLCNQFGPSNPVVVQRQARAPYRPDAGRQAGLDLSARSIESKARRSWADSELVALAHVPGGDALKAAPLLSVGSAKELPAKPEARIRDMELARFKER